MKREQYGKARIVLVAVIDEEFDAVQRLGQLTSRCAATGYYARQASPSKEYDLVLCRADGWGNLASGEAVAEAIEDFRPSYILLVGVAGGIVRSGDNDPIRLGDVVVADYLHYSELKKLVEEGMAYRYKAHDHPSLHLRLSFAEPLRKDANRWIGRIQAKPPSATTPVARIGNLVTGETLLGNPKHPYQQDILSDYYTATAVDMESMGVGREIFKQRRDPYYNPQFLVIRGVSDEVHALTYGRSWFSRVLSSLRFRAGFRQVASAATNQAMRDAWRVYAAEAAAAFALTLVDDLLDSIGSLVPPGVAAPEAHPR